MAILQRPTSVTLANRWDRREYVLYSFPPLGLSSRQLAGVPSRGPVGRLAPTRGQDPRGGQEDADGWLGGRGVRGAGEQGQAWREQGRGAATPGAGRSQTPSPSRLIKALALLSSLPLSAFPFDLTLPPPKRPTKPPNRCLPPPTEQPGPSTPFAPFDRKPPRARDSITSGCCSLCRRQGLTSGYPHHRHPVPPSSPVHIACHCCVSLPASLTSQGPTRSPRLFFRAS